MQNGNIFGNLSAGGISCSTHDVSVSWTWLRCELEGAQSCTSFRGWISGFRRPLQYSLGQAQLGLNDMVKKGCFLGK